MTVNLKQLKKITRITSSGSTTVYTTPLSKDTLVSKMSLSNVGVTDAIAQVHLVDKSGIATTTNKYYTDYEIKAGKTKSLYELEGHILTAEQFIVVSINAAAINVTLSGAELS